VTVLGDRLTVVIDDRPYGSHLVTDVAEADWWLPVLGPTAMALLSTIVRHTPSSGEWATTDLAARVGLGALRSKLAATIDRLVIFRAASWEPGGRLVVRAWLPELSDRQIGQLPDSMAAAYRARVDAVHTARLAEVAS
jgi:hypothetical protein